MKIKGTNLEVSSIGDFEKIKSSIASKDLGLALTMVSKNLYSNPIGSFIRELTSNAVDANVDADINEAVLVHLYEEGDAYYMEFKDNGTGMSPEIFREVYMSWFNSDKRDSNTKIGGWGLGSKSPLSYQDSFEVITRFNSIEYHYVLVNEGAEPDATLLTSNETDSPNGTTIRVEINARDTNKVYDETIKQLAYFRNVYVKNDLRYYDNNFRLYESDKYILRNVNQPFGTEMHICLGQVAYPLNWNVLSIDRINIPVGVKFEIGELDVTLSREEINYTEEVKSTILERVTEVKDALIAKYEEQLEITDFRRYLEILRDRNKPKLIIEDVSIDMGDIKINPSFSPLEGLKFVKKYFSDLFSLYTVEGVSSGRRRGYVSTNITDYIHTGYQSDHAYLVKDRLNTYDTAYINDRHSSYALIRRKKLDKKSAAKIAKAAGLLENAKEFDEGWNVKPIFKTGYIGGLSKVIKYIDDYMNNLITEYDGIASDEWVENYKAEQQALYEERKQTLTYYNIYNNRTTVNWGELIDKYKAIFYINKEDDKRNIIAYEYLYDQLPAYFRKNSVFLIISPSVITKVKNKPKFVPAEKIFKIKEFKNPLYKIKLSKLINKEFKDGHLLFSYSKLYYEMYRKLITTYNLDYKVEKGEVPVKNGSYNTTATFKVDILEHFQEQFDRVKPTKSRKYLPYEEYIEELKQVRDRLDVLKYITDDCPHNHKVRIIGRLGVLRLNPQYYRKEIN